MTILKGNPVDEKQLELEELQSLAAELHISIHLLEPWFTGSLCKDQ